MDGLYIVAGGLLIPALFAFIYFWREDHPKKPEPAQEGGVDLAEEMEKVEIVLDRITIYPSICPGQPTIRGLKITVSLILGLLASGMPHDRILKAYPELEAEDIAQSLQYAAWLSSGKTMDCSFQ